ncbi:helix-turn-helix domain-containing protein [Micromonospora globbae]|uniref:XRE family transcriptional regulator n=1 Tax=Micromonospora globbae TaxID=1894969 RepID=A0A420ETU0_9ACTN|nr:helix-turn-helix transcriptional regulator [Micromonospora globbae]RKF24126.1 XRE family transcriptional regulator [Micromonospora globbae]
MATGVIVPQVEHFRNVWREAMLKRLGKQLRDTCPKRSNDRVKPSPAQLKRVASVRALAAGGDARAIREAANVSLREAARALKISPATLSRWETGTASPRVGRQALRWAAFLDDLKRIDR